MIQTTDLRQSVQDELVAIWRAEMDKGARVQRPRSPGAAERNHLLALGLIEQVPLGSDYYLVSPEGHDVARRIVFEVAA